MSDENVFIGAPTGSGKTVCAEFALLRLWSKREQPRAVCILPFQEMVDMRVEEWRRKFGNVQGGKEVLALTGETSADLRLLEKGDVVICTPNQVGLSSFEIWFFFESISFCSGMCYQDGGGRGRTCRISDC